MSRAAEEGRLALIRRHPIKAHGREALASVTLLEGQALPWDRHWAVAHAGSKFDPAAPEWISCGHFQRAARTPGLMAITAVFDPQTGHMQLSHPDLAPLSFYPDREGERLIDWLLPISPEGMFQPAALVKAPGRAMTDSAWPSVSINSLSSNALLGAEMGIELSPERWRGNLWLEGFEPFAEQSWIGRQLRIGAALLEIREPIGRCKATTVDPETGLVAGDTLAALRALRGVQEFGVYAVVMNGGEIRPGDKVEVI